MSIEDQIKDYIAAQPEQKRNDMQMLHHTIMKIMPDCKLWFLDGKDDGGKTVSNPNIGYGLQTLKYVDGSAREFYQIGISSNTKGISVYIMGIGDKKHLAETYGQKLGKASVTGYCIRFKTLEDINTDVLYDAILDGVRQTA